MMVSSKRTGRRRCVEKVFYKFTNIQKQKAHLSNKNDYILSGKKLYTHDLNFFFFLNFNSFWQS